MRSSLALLVVLFVGCGDDGSSVRTDGGPGSDADQQTMDFALAVDPATLSVPLLGSGTVSVTVTRTNFDEAITLSAADLPTGVTIEFDPPTLAAGQDTSVATLSLAAGAAAGTSTITISGTAGALAQSATLSFTATALTITGTVASGASGITVGLVGKPSTTTGSGGTFTFTDVTPPYDLYTVSTAAGLTHVYYYKGLTRTDPVVVHMSDLVSVSFSVATVSGTLSGGIGAVHRHVLWGDTAGQMIPTTTSYSFPASWPSAATKAGTVHAIEWTTLSSGAPDQIVYGSTSATLTANVASANVDIAMSAPQTAIINGTITPPAGFTNLLVTTVTQQFGSNSLPMATDFSGVLDVKVPVIAAGKATVYSEIIEGTGETARSSYFVHPAIDANTDVTYQMLAPAELTAPAEGGTAGATTDFTFTAPPNQIHAVHILTLGAVKVAYHVYTTEQSVRIPNVSEAMLPAGQSFFWNVAGHGPHTSIDEAATANGLEIASKTDFVGPRYTYTSSPVRTFTSQ